MPIAAELFEEGWSRVRGRGVRSGNPGADYDRSKGPGASLARSAHMARAATGARPAVFKAIRNGGTHNRTELASQLTYVATKSCYVFDARGEYDGQRVLTPAQIEEATKRFAQTWDKARPTKLGHTSHLLLSFPLGTKTETVRDVTCGVVEQFFQGQGAHFDYIVAVHDDRAHKHAHVILNRHSPDGEMFYLRSGHHHSYELFREAMVEHGDRYGLRLEATRRLDRGLVTYDARSVEVQQARVVGVELIERERVGPDLERAQRHIALASLTYRGLAGAASHEGFHQVSEALLRASLTLANNGIVLPTREIEMADTQGSFDGLVREFGRNVQALEERIASAPPAQRPRLERGLTEALSSVASLNPLGENSATLRQAPSTFGVYSQARIERDELGRLDDPSVSAAVDAAVQGTGLAVSEVLARVRVGADSAALEDHWHHSDVQAVGARLGLDTARPEAKEQVLDRLEDAYGRIETTLQEVGVLREARVEGDERERAEEVRARGVDLPSPAQRAVERDPLVDATAARVRDQAPAEYAFAGDDAVQAQPFRAALERQLGPDELARLRQGDETVLSRIGNERAHQQALAKAYLESDPTSRDTPAHARVLDAIADDQVDALRARHARQEAEEHAATQPALRPDDRTSPDADKGDPLIAATAARVRDQAAAEYAFRDAAQAKAFKDVVERELAPEELAQLRQGDESALSRLSDDRLDRLALAKAYLESDQTTRDTAAQHRVLDEIVDGQFDERRLAWGHEEDGHIHG